MRVLVIDQDSALLTAITQLLGEYFAIDAVTNKADCLDLVRVNEFDVIVAGERLQDGSGLELLSQLARSHPDILRIFAAEPGRLKLLKGRLGPFGLFRTLQYPIEPRQLLAALSAAAGVMEEEEEREEESDVELEEGFEAEFEATPTPAPAAPARAAVSAPVTPPQRLVPQLETPTRIAAVTTAAVAGQRSGAATAEPRATRESIEKSGGRSRTRGGSPARPNDDGSPQQRRVRQPTPEALALGSRLAATSRPKGFAPPSLAASAQRSAFVVGAGVALVVGGLILVLRIFSPSSLHTNLASTQPPTFPPEVLKLVADTETAFQLDDLKTARTDIAALQQLAPTHPGLSFFESQLAQRQAEAAAAKMPAPAKRAAVIKEVNPRPAEVTARPVRRRPSGSATFSGKTLEETSADTPLAANVPQTKSPSTARASTDSTVTREPRVIQRVAAEYPTDAARKGIEGAVDLSFSISAQGEVYDVTVLHSEPSNIFNRAAISAVRRWKYEPKTVDGVPVEARAQLRLTFKLDEHGQ
jgi:TonB family protein